MSGSGKGGKGGKGGKFGKGRKQTPAQRSKKRVNKRISIAQKSTGSRGYYDEKAHKFEPKMKKKMRVEFTPARNAKEEIKRSMGNIFSFLKMIIYRNS